MCRVDEWVHLTKGIEELIEAADLASELLG